MTQKMYGWISEYWAQGMESEVWRIFQDRAYARNRMEDWDLAGTHQLGEGDTLTILADSGQVLWSGVLQSRPVGLFKLRKIGPGQPNWSPQGVSLAEWHSWFRRKPLLAAVLQPA